MTADLTAAAVPPPRPPADDRPPHVPADVWACIHPKETGMDEFDPMAFCRDSEGWHRCGAYEWRLGDVRTDGAK